MKEYLKRLPQETLTLVEQACSLAGHRHMAAYLVGGFVRDLILGVRNLDLDIVVEGDGIAFAEELATRLEAKLIGHIRFGTATVILKSSHKIDITSARIESYPHPAHLPVVSKGTLQDDLFRRDFTINAMAISLNKEDYGTLIDIFSGVKDLRDKKIRILHNLSFIDDPTRILRAVRFEQRYDFKIEPKTLRLLKEAVSAGMLQKVQPQRLRDDLILILKESDPLKEIRRLNGLTGFHFINSRFRLSDKNYALLRSVNKEISWYRKNYSERRRLDEWIIYLMALMDSLSITEASALCKRFVFRKGEEKRIIDYKKISRSFVLKLNKPGISPTLIFRSLEPLSYEAVILLKARFANPAIQRHIKDFFEIYNGMRILIDGSDLQKLGIAPGPYYQKIFTKVFEAKLEGKVLTRIQELGLINEILRKDGTDPNVKTRKSF